MCRPGRQHLFLTVDQIAGIEASDFKSMAVRDGVGWARLDTISAEDAAVVIDVVNLGVALCATDAVFGGILRRLNVNAVRRAGCSTQEAGYALFQAVFVALQDVDPTEAFLKLRSPKGTWAVRVVFDLRGFEHLAERDAHPLGNSGDVFKDRHCL